ncbi:hypothetical protein C8F01DRAFT_1253506 [Mycena amicta]|nr:hypothetical protein C8F01DRAFT_1253506 [Mycena amicta]
MLEELEIESGLVNLRQNGITLELEAIAANSQRVEEKFRVIDAINNGDICGMKVETWSRKADAAMAAGGLEAEPYRMRFDECFHLNATSTENGFEPPSTANLQPANGPAGMDSRADEATPYTNTDGDRAVPEVERDEFRGASVHLPGGKGFVKWMEEDQFSGLRGDNLFYPFSGDMELGLASFLSTSSLTMKEIDRFLSLEMVKKHLGPSLSFKSAKELRQRVELLPTGPKWSSKTITCAGFPTKKPIVLFYRNSLECIQFLIRNPLFKNHIDFVPTKLYQDQQQLHKEWINSESAWKMQEAIPAGRTVLGVVASSDKTNISMDVAMKASNHAFLMTALLPVVKFMCAKELRGVMESRLFHHCLDIVCAPLKLAARDGAIFLEI